MANNNPIVIAPHEWEEIRSHEDVIEAWGLDWETSPKDFSESVYGAKFNFESGSPGWCGELYVIFGDVLQEPMVLYRDNDIASVFENRPAEKGRLRSLGSNPE